MKLGPKCVAFALVTSITSAVNNGPANAQDIAVFVTGSNIKRVDWENAAPFQTITRESIQASGLQSVQEVVRQITANNNASISPSFFNGFSASGAGVSLRGLGANSTLVLVNGRRMANFALADDGRVSYVDLSQIPLDAVDRIEVLKDGASAIYGSDAIAGIVNVILRKQFTGVMVSGSVGTTHNGEGDQGRAAITAGTGNLSTDRYNAFVTLEYQKQQAIRMSTGRQYVGSNDFRPMGLPDARPGNPLSGFFDQSLLGNVRPVSAADVNGDPGDFQSLAGACAPGNQDSGFCRWEVKDYLDIVPKIERFNVFGRGTIDFGNSIHGYAELSYFQVETLIRNPPVWSRATWFDPSTISFRSSLNVYLPVGHPDNPFSSQNQVARLYYSDGALGSIDTQYKTGTQRYLVGVDGTTNGWDWDVGALHVRSATDIARRHQYNADRFLQGLAGTGPFGYYRIGASSSLNDPAIYDWIAPEFSWTAVSETTLFDAKATREVYKLDAGAIALAVGYEFRREKLSNPGAPGSYTGDIHGYGYSAAFGSRNVNALYAELAAPILRDLEITAAIRYDDYSDVGSTVNPKLTVRWKALPSFVLRGTAQKGFRAPGFYESSIKNAVAGSSAVVDPVRCPVTQLAADCSAYVVAVFTGNPDIRPEKSKGYTVGAIWEPRSGLSGTLDYWNIEVKDQITFGSLQATVDDPSKFPAARVGRDTNDLPGIPNSGTLLYIQAPYQNANKVKTDGLDLDVIWRQPLQQWGTLRTELQWTRVLNYEQTFSNGVTLQFAGTQGNYDVSSAAGTPKDRANLIIGWQRGPWNAAGTVRYVSDYEEIPYKGVPVPDGCLAALTRTSCHVSSFTTLDLSAAYTGFKNWEIFGSVVNVFNRIAPFNPSAAYGNVNYNFNYALSGATGTQFNVGARYSFQ